MTDTTMQKATQLQNTPSLGNEQGHHHSCFTGTARLEQFLWEDILSDPTKKMINNIIITFLCITHAGGWTTVARQ
jgi:hypothetical protein